MKMDSSKVWDILINKAHVGIAVICQASILIMHWKYGKDLTPNIQQTVNWFYLFLAGHFGASQVWPDQNPSLPLSPPTQQPPGPVTYGR